MQSLSKVSHIRLAAQGQVKKVLRNIAKDNYIYRAGLKFYNGSFDNRYCSQQTLMEENDPRIQSEIVGNCGFLLFLQENSFGIYVVNIGMHLVKMVYAHIYEFAPLFFPPCMKFYYYI